MGYSIREGGWESSQLKSQEQWMWLPTQTLSGPTEILVIKDLPFELDTVALQLEVFLFNKGKPQSLPDIDWTISEPWAEVDENHRLSVSGTGALTLTATVIGKPLLQASVSTLVVPAVSTSHRSMNEAHEIRVYPNPARNTFRISGMEEKDLTLFDLSGRALRTEKAYQADREIDIADLLPGLYLVRIGRGPSSLYLKLLKH